MKKLEGGRLLLSMSNMEYTQVLFSILDLFVDYPPQRLGVVAPK